MTTPRILTSLLFLLIICAGILWVRADRIYLIDGTGHFFEPTNAARTLNAIDAADIRGGSQLLTVPETTKAITFAVAMKDATYIVLATPNSQTTVWVTQRTTNGFTLNLSTGIAGRVDWLAINP